MDNYWQAQFDPWTQSTRSIAQSMMQLPALRAQAGHLRAATESAKATARYTDERTQELIRKGQLVDNLEKHGGAAMRALVEQRFDDPSIETFTGSAAALTGENKGDIQKSLATGIGTLLARQGHVPEAAAVENPVSVQNNQVNAEERANRPVVAGNGSTVFTPEGTKLGEAAFSLSPGQNRFPAQGADEMGGTVQPEATGQPAPPKSSAQQEILDRAIAHILTDPNNTDAQKKRGMIEALKNNLGAGQLAKALTVAPAPAPATNAPVTGIPATATTAAGPAKVLTPDMAAQYLKRTGNRAAAEAAAKQDGYSW